MAATFSLLPAACSLVLLRAVLLSLLTSPTAAEQVLLGNSALHARQALHNRNRGHRLVMRGDCNLVLSEFDIPLWHSNSGRLGSSCQVKLKPSGQLVVSDRRSNTEIWWSTNSAVQSFNYVLVLQNDLNVVIYSKPVSAVRMSDGSVKHQAGDQILLAGQVLHGGQCLEDENMHFQFVMQEDCDLVLYDDLNVIWSSGTSGMGSGCRAILTTNGNLVIQDLSGVAVWASSVDTPDWSKYALLLLPDGNVAVYTGAVWSTGTSFLSATEPPPSGGAAGGGQAVVVGPQPAAGCWAQQDMMCGHRLPTWAAHTCGRHYQ